MNKDLKNKGLPGAKPRGIPGTRFATQINQRFKRGFARSFSRQAARYYHLVFRRRPRPTASAGLGSAEMYTAASISLLACRNKKSRRSSQRGRAKNKSARRGQSLLEVLIATGLGVIMIIGAMAVIVPAINIDERTRRIQTASSLGRELLENVKVIAGRDWHDITTLATTSTNRHYVDASSSPFAIVSGTEEITLSTTTYTRSFYIDDVYRNVSDKIAEGGSSLDPSTKKVTVVYEWPPGQSTSSFVAYITRHKNRVFRQTDWSAGAGQSGPITATTTNSRFATSSNVDFTTTTGSIYVDGI